MTTETPRIYVADLAAYNSGFLHGTWIDATQELEEIWTDIKAMLQDSPVTDPEEWAIHDYENFGGYSVGEYENLESLQAIACFIEEHGELGGKLLEHWCGDINQAKQSIEDHYCGQYESLADYAQELTESTTEIPPSLQLYIDYAAIGRDMTLSGDIFTIETSHDEVHIFWNH